MQEVLRFILLFTSLVSGAIAILFSFQLMRRHNVAFLSSYFYYIVFIYIFGSYSLIGSGVLEYLFHYLEAGQEAIHSAKLFAILPGIPLLLLSKYMFLRCTTELFRRKNTRTFTVFFLVISMILIGLYGFFAVRLTRFDQGDYQVIAKVQRWAFTGLMIIVYAAAFTITQASSRTMVEHERTFTRQFGITYLLFMILTGSAFVFSEFWEIMKFAFILFFLSWHLIPILFLNVYMEKYHGKGAGVRPDFETMLSQFSSRYDISKRESEVVRLICKGLSNQEISEALFISLQTVKDHTHRIFVKTGVKNRVQLANLMRTE